MLRNLLLRLSKLLLWLILASVLLVVSGLAHAQRQGLRRQVRPAAMRPGP